MNVQETSGAGSPISYGITPILTIDVWEHAYVSDYRSTGRAKYVDKHQ